MKKLLCLLLTAALVLAWAGTAWAFTDTENLSEAQTLALEHLSKEGVIDGYPDGTFKPEGEVSRAEFAKMLCVFAGQSQLHTDAETFVDVTAEDWYGGWVARAAQKEWINGYPGREYRPKAQITQQEIATVLVRVSGLSREDFVWPDDYVAAAEEAGLFENMDFAANTPASRITACQMMYNTPLPELEPSVEATLMRGVITSLGEREITVVDYKGKSGVYTYAAGVMPQDIFPGAYIEGQVEGNVLHKVEQVFNAKKETAYWDIAIDGKTAQIDGKKYDIEEAEIFVVSYGLSKPYSADTFIKAGPIDYDILSLGGRMAAEMAVILEESGSTLKRAYVVNAAVVISGGRFDVVEGAFSSAKGSGMSFVGRSGGLPLAGGVTPPPTVGSFIHYDIRNGEISGYTELYAPGGGLADLTNVLKGGGEDAPTAWVGSNGSSVVNGTSIIAFPEIINIGSGRNTVQLGADSGNNANYFLAEGCMIYEVENGEISSGGKGSMEKGQQVVALVNKYSEICYLFCIIP